MDGVYALAALAAYLLVPVVTCVSLRVTGVFRISHGRVGPTEVRQLVTLAGAASARRTSRALVPPPALGVLPARVARRGRAEARGSARSLTRC